MSAVIVVGTAPHIAGDVGIGVIRHGKRSVTSSFVILVVVALEYSELSGVKP